MKAFKFELFIFDPKDTAFWKLAIEPIIINLSIFNFIYKEHSFKVLNTVEKMADRLPIPRIVVLQCAISNNGFFINYSVISC